MKKQFYFFKTPLIFLLFLFAYNLHAQWSTDPMVNNPICTKPNQQQAPQIISDSEGGAIIAWTEFNGVDYDIYAQKIDSEGTVKWIENGIVICDAIYDQISLDLVSDDNGGAIIVWDDYRYAENGNSSIYAQRVNSNGTPLWTPNGVSIYIGPLYGCSPKLCTDGEGGAIIVWEDFRIFESNIYAQRINLNGTVEWTENGITICNALYPQDFPVLISDDNGGAIIVWEDYRWGNWDIYAQKINSNGTAYWVENGVEISGEGFDQRYPRICSNENGGAMVVCTEYVGSGSYVCMGELKANGTGGVGRIYDGPFEIDQEFPEISSDGTGWAIITWVEEGFYICAQYTGYADTICTSGSGWSRPKIISDGNGGAIITWSNGDIYSQKINSDGIQWTENGVAVCTAVNNQISPILTSDNNGGAIITWIDYRSGQSYDIYASRVNQDGLLPVELNSFTAKAGKDNVRLIWRTETEVNNYGFEIERQVGNRQLTIGNEYTIRNPKWEKIGFVQGNGNTNSPKEYSFVDENLNGGSKFQYRLKQIDNDGQFAYSDVVEAEVVPDKYELSQNYPNPFNPSTKIKYSITEPGKVKLTLFNLLGEEVTTLVNEEKPAGNYSIDFNAANLPSGVYFYQLRVGNFVQSRKMILLK